MGMIRRPLTGQNFSATNVVDMTAFRKRLRATTAPELIPVFYLHEGGSSETAIRSFPLLDVTSVNCPEKLELALLEKRPALILVESFLSWADPVELVERFVSKTGCTALMVYRPEEKSPEKGKTTKLLKRAFQVGLFDTLTSPVTREDLRERLNIAFRLNARRI